MFNWVVLKELLDKLFEANNQSDHLATRKILQKLVVGFDPEQFIKDILYKSEIKSKII